MGVKDEEVVNPYLYNWDNWVKWYDLGPDAANWNEPAKYNWAVQKDKDKGQGPKGETNPKTDPWGMIFEPSARALKNSRKIARMKYAFIIRTH